MRDVIWTIILIWLIYKLIDIVRALNTSRNAIKETVNEHTSQPKHNKNDTIREAVNRHIDKTGEYVDFEEMPKDH